MIARGMLRPSPEKLRTRAEEYERKGKNHKALESYRELAELEPTDPDVWVLLGEKELALGGEAPLAAQAFFRATDLLLRGGMFREAAEVCQRSLEADRRHGPARRLQGIIERRLRRLAGEEDPEPPPSLPKVIVEAAPAVVAVEAAPAVVAVEAVPPGVAVEAVPPGVAVEAVPPGVAVEAAPAVVKAAPAVVAVEAAPAVVKAAPPVVAVEAAPAVVAIAVPPAAV